MRPIRGQQQQRLRGSSICPAVQNNWQRTQPQEQQGEARGHPSARNEEFASLGAFSFSREEKEAQERTRACSFDAQGCGRASRMRSELHSSSGCGARACGRSSRACGKIHNSSAAVAAASSGQLFSCLRGRLSSRDAMFFIPTKPCAPASPCCCVYLAISLFMTTEHTLGTSQARRRDAQLAARVRVKDASKSP